MQEDFDTVVVGAGIAGLGVAAVLASEAGEKVLVLDRYDRPGGRLMSFADTPGKGWKVDIGLHMTELGDASSIHALNARVGVDVAWGPFSETVQFYHEGKFVNIAELVPMSGDERRDFGATLRLIAEMEDAEIAAWDDRSLAEWLAENVPSEAVRDLFTDMGMIMTTIPDAIDMAAGEVLYIGRDNLRKKSQLLTSCYPIGGMEAFTRGLVKVIEDNWGKVETGREVSDVIISGGRARGVRVARSGGGGPYPGYYAIPVLEEITAGKVICALPIYQLPAIIDFQPRDLAHAVVVDEAARGYHARGDLPGGIHVRPLRAGDRQAVLLQRPAHAPRRPALPGLPGLQFRRLGSLPRAGNCSTPTWSASTRRHPIPSSAGASWTPCGWTFQRCSPVSRTRWSGRCLTTWRDATAWPASPAWWGTSSPSCRRPAWTVSSSRATPMSVAAWP